MRQPPRRQRSTQNRFLRAEKAISKPQHTQGAREHRKKALAEGPEAAGRQEAHESAPQRRRSDAAGPPPGRHAQKTRFGEQRKPYRGPSTPGARGSAREAPQNGGKRSGCDLRWRTPDPGAQGSGKALPPQRKRDWSDASPLKVQKGPRDRGVRPLLERGEAPPKRFRGPPLCLRAVFFFFFHASL